MSKDIRYHFYIKGQILCIDNDTASKKGIFCPDYDFHSILSSFFKDNNIAKLNISNCTIKDKLYISQKKDKTNIENSEDKTIYISDNLEVEIKNVIFENNFKLWRSKKSNKKYILNLYDVTFKENVDFFGAQFSKIKLFRLDCHGLALFGECIFDEKVYFEYATFRDSVHFREAEFKQGLDLEKTNLSQNAHINFFNSKGLDAKTSIKETSQETYRIIKFNFNQIGNKIEANKYHALELKKKSENKLTNFQERLEWTVLKLHWISSRNATNWILPLLWICVVGALSFIVKISEIDAFLFIYFMCLLMVCLCIYFFKSEDITSYVPPILLIVFLFLYMFGNNFNIEQITQYTYILHWWEKDCSGNNTTSFIFIFNKTILGYLYYQFITAIRLNTRQN